MSLGFAARLAALSLTVLAAASCKAENDNDVACAEEDCASSCASLGFPGGECADGACACDTSDTDPFEWDGGGDADADADADTDADTDTGTDTGSELADGGADLG